jgi:hypothetical protein
MAATDDPGISVLFCAKGIEKAGLDTGVLIYTTNFDGEESDQQTQQLFCHAACLRAAVHQATPLYALEDLGSDQ